MKNLNLALLYLSIVFVFASCDKKVETSALELNKDKFATIKGYVYAELDKTSAGLEMVTPATVPSINIKISNADYLAGVNGSYEDTVSLNNDGSFDLTVPADDDGVTVNITPLPFEANQTQSYGNYEPTVKKIFKAGTTPVFVRSGEIEIAQITYVESDFINYVPMVNISGQIYANLSDTVIGAQEVNKAVTIDFHTSDWVGTTTTDSDGVFSIDVPKDEEILVTSTFQANFYNDFDQSKILQDFSLESSSIGTFAASAEDIGINFGNGTDVE